MSKPEIHWQYDGGWRHYLGILVRAVSVALGQSRQDNASGCSEEDFLELKERPESDLYVFLTGQSAYFDRFDSRTRNFADLRKVIENQISEIVPLSDETCTILIDRDQEEPTVANVLLLKSDRLKALEDQAAKLGLPKLSLCHENQPHYRVLSPSSLQQRKTSNALWCIAPLALALSIWLAAGAVLDRQNAHLAELKLYEGDIRQLMIEREERDKAIGALEALANRKVNSQIAQARLQTLIDLASDVPEETWWHEVELNGKVVRLTGASSNAAAVLRNLSVAYPDKQAKFSKPITNEGNGFQSYVIEVEMPS